MHEYRRFVQSELDARGWKQADLVRRSGLSRQVISKILRDDREYLGQMPDESTLAALATGFEVPIERVRTAAARALARYDDDGEPLTADLSSVSIDALLQEIKRRVSNAVPSDSSAPTRASGEAGKDKKTRTADGRDHDAGTDPEGRVADQARPNVWRQYPSNNDDDVEEVEDLPAAARRGKGKTKGEQLRDEHANLGEEIDPEGPEGGA